MPRHDRIARDVDLDEEAELRRLESGADEPGLLCQARGLYGFTAQGATAQGVTSRPGCARLFTGRLTWTPDADEPEIRLEVSQIQNVQSSKPALPKARLKILVKPEAGGGAHIFDLTDSEDVERSKRARDTIRDVLETGVRQLAAPAAHPPAAHPPAAHPPAAKRPRPSSPPPSPAATPAAASAAAAASSSLASGRPSTAAVTRPPDGGGLFEGGLTLAEREAADEALKADGELRRLYTQLTNGIGGREAILTPKEFWAQRRHLLYASSQVCVCATYPAMPCPALPCPALTLAWLRFLVLARARVCVIAA